eukprot:m.298752 g.298752  ORF g.298752 m.298752 type:complete len:260 (-) comp19539_c0_seq1:92-871(-)
MCFRDTFIEEYCGEIYDLDTFEQRRVEYASLGLQHFFFMTLDSDTLIDSTRKGNQSRFINHSCEPNCETQKWTVNGQTRIGFFSIRDIEAMEEITFDYKYENYGDNPQTCYCGTPSCRGTLGGKAAGTASERRRSSGGKRRRVGAAQANQFQDKLSRLLGPDGGLKDEKSTITFMQQLVRTDSTEQRSAQLDVVLATSASVCLESMMRFKILRILRHWLAEANDDAFVLKVRFASLRFEHVFVCPSSEFRGPFRMPVVS